MNFLIEFDKSKNNVAEIYRNVLSKKAKAVKIVDDKENIVTVELWFSDKDFFEAMVNLIVEIDFIKVSMINNGDDEEPTDEAHEDEITVEEKPTGGKVPVENPPPVKGDVPKTEAKPEITEPPASGNAPVGGEPVEGEALTGDELLKAAAAVNEVLALDSGNGANKPPAKKQEEKPAEQEPPKKKTTVATGKGSRKREGKELTNLLEIPDFPTEFTLEKVLDFFKPMKDTVIEPLKTVLMIALDKDKECSMEWKDLVAVAAEMGIHLSDFDKVKYSKQIADILEQHGYSVRAKSFLKLLRRHVSGEVKNRKEKPEKKEEEPASKKVEVLTDMAEFKWLEGQKYTISQKEDVIASIMKSMKANEILSENGRRLFYYMAISAASMKCYTSESMFLLMEDIAVSGVKRDDKLESELNDFVKNFMKQYGLTAGYKFFMNLISEYFKGVFTENDLDFVKSVKIYEAAFGIEKKPEPKKEPVKESRFAMIPYHEGLEDLFTRLWDEGHGLDEMLVEMFAYMSGEDLDDDEVAYLSVCAERIAFDSLNDIYLDLDKSQTETRKIQTALSEKLNTFIEANNFKAVKLYDFLSDVREIFERDA